MNASANNVSLLSSLETAYNEAPDQTAVMRRIPFATDSLKPMKETVEDETINPDRSSEKSLLVRKTAGGTTNHIMDLLNFQEPFAELIQSGPLLSGTASTVAVTITTVSEGFQLVATGGVFAPFQDPKPGYVNIQGANNPLNNGNKRLVSVANSNTMVISADTLGANGSETVTIRSKMFRNGSERKSRLVEKHWGDVSKRHHYRGMELVAGALEITAREQIRVSFDWAGAQFGSGFAADQSASAGDTVSELDPLVADRLTASHNVGKIYNGANSLGFCVRSITLNLNNNMRDEACVGSLVRTENQSNGALQVTGSLSGLFKDSDLVETLDAHSSIELVIPMTDAAGNTWAIVLPEVALDTVDLPTEGRNSSVVQSYNFSASKDPTYGTQIQIEPLTTLNIPG